ncbi:MAG: A/G-specific adenine glycosylase [Anaerolineae bacterium]
MVKSPEVPEFYSALLTWYQVVAADFAWRQDRDPYRVWLSEVMLQQTQVKTVTPYFTRFIEAFPNVHRLAEASLEQVLKLWEGLGYYSRARNLHRAAQQIVGEFGGVLPRSAIQLQRLPGIGRYTAGAIASIAFGESAPALDGNVIRVLSRLYDFDQLTESPQAQRQLWSWAEALARAAPPDRMADYTQAMMELGREICTPRRPKCTQCPVQDFCQAKAANTQMERPVKAAKRAVPHYAAGGALLQGEQARILIVQRPPEGLLGGLWEFPQIRCDPDELPHMAAAKVLREYLNLAAEIGPELTRVRHTFTHFKITLHVFEAVLLPTSRTEPESLYYPAWRWVQRQELSQFAFPKADRKVIDFLQRGQDRLC